MYDAYFGLGDSISIDTYTEIKGGGAISLLYKNLDDVHPDFQGRDLVSLNPGMKLFNLAFDGATTAGVWHQLECMRPATFNKKVLATLTVGGNDLLKVLHSRILDEADAEIQKLMYAIDNLLKDMRQMGDDITIIIGSIYDPSHGTGHLFGEDISPILHLLHKANKGIKKLAKERGALFVDIHGHFLGHKEWFVYDIEPNAVGASEVRRLFLEALWL